MDKIDLKTLNVGKNPKLFMGTSKAGYNATEIVYNNVVVPKILPKLGFEDVVPSTELEVYLADRADGKQAIDHFFKDSRGTYVSVQTRFRAPMYEKYGDFTVRYDKPSSMAYTGKQVECEYYHFNADLMLYGICDYDLSEKDKKGNLIGAQKVTDLKCWVLINLAIFRNLCKNKKIMLQENLVDKKGKWLPYKVIDDTLVCPIKKNTAIGDTRFITINLKKCVKLFPELIIAQEGFI